MWELVKELVVNMMIVIAREYRKILGTLEKRHHRIQNRSQNIENAKKATLRPGASSDGEFATTDIKTQRNPYTEMNLQRSTSNRNGSLLNPYPQILLTSIG